MKILYLLSDFPYPIIKGPRIQTFELLKYMVHYAECHVLAFCDSDTIEKIDYFKALIPDVRILGLFHRRSGISLQIGRVRHLMRLNPVFLARWENDNFKRCVELALRNENYDIVHLEGISLAHYLNLCQKKPTVLSTIDAISLAQRRTIEKNPFKKIYRKFASLLVKRFERKILPKATIVHVVSHVDCQYLRHHICGLDVENIEIVIPEELINYQIPSYEMEDEKHHTILFTGNLSIYGIAKGLIQFIYNAYPTILRVCPDTQIVVLGQNAPPKLQKQIENLPKVRYVSWAKDYYSELSKAQVIIFPDLSGAGIKNRVLQAMALAKAVVGTPIALEGIPAKDGVHCFIRTTDEGFSQAVIALLRDSQLRKRIGASARELVLNNFTMDIVGPKWLSLYERAIQKFYRR